MSPLVGSFCRESALVAEGAAIRRSPDHLEDVGWLCRSGKTDSSRRQEI
jgi:hypothetical protein